MPAHLVEARSQLGQEARASGARRRAHADAPDAGGADQKGAGVEQHGATRETRLTKRPPRAAPTPKAMLRVMPSSALACCSRLARRDLRHEARGGGHEERRGRGVQRVERDEVPDARLAAQQERSRPTWMTARVTSDASRIVRRGRRSAHTPPISTNSVCGRMPATQDDAERGRRAAEIEHRERERDREDAVAEHRDRLRPEEERELALAQDRAACAPAPTGASLASRFWPVISGGGARPSRPSTVGREVAELAALAQVRARERDDERHGVRRVRRVRRAVGLEHLLGVAVIGGHERDAARAARRPRGSRRARRRRPRRPRSPPAGRRSARPCRGSRG